MRKTPILHPFLLAIYPVLAFLAYNIEQTSLGAALRPLFVSLGGAVILFLFLKLVLKESRKAGAIATTLLGFFFTYGHFYNMVEGTTFLGINLGRHRLLAPLWLALAVLIVVWLARQRRDFQTLTHVLNAIGIVAIILPLAQIGMYRFSTRSISTQAASNRGIPGLPPNTDHPKPDIYYIILDTYSRDDMLKKYYQLDNSSFLSRLEAMGFYVARCAQSNYSQSELSMASSLNFDYLDKLGDNFNPPNTRRAGLSDLIQHSAVRETLHELGYTTVALDTGYDPTRITDADVYLAPRVSAEINDFEEIFLRTTAARLLSEGVAFLNLPPDWVKRDQAHRARILFELEQMRQIPTLPGPKFVFAHIITPHWPYVFGPNGEQVHERPESEKGYHDQVLFINQQMIPILENILTRSKTPPVIIVQGDHGAVLEDPHRRMTILNVYYLPDGGRQLLYENISPVNTFRVILNHYFGLHLPLQEDISYYSTYEQPYNYQVIDNTRSGCNKE